MMSVCKWLRKRTVYGEWPSPIEGADIARKQVGLAFPTIAGPAVWWQETRPSEGGRLAVVTQGPDGISRDLLPLPWNARTRVHEYGGKSYLPLPDGFIFANFSDQRLYRCGVPESPGRAEPVPLTPAPDDLTADRFADLVLSPGGNEVWCVRERHSAGPEGGGRVSRAIVAVPLDGSAAEDPGAVRVLVSGSDFYAFPAPSPDGTRLAWICWDHPRMPWDGTELRVVALDDRGPVSDKSQQQLIMGCDSESVLAPVWRDDRSLYVISDRSGWWNLYLADLLAFPRPLCPREEEFAGPLWQLGAEPLRGARRRPPRRRARNRRDAAGSTRPGRPASSPTLTCPTTFSCRGFRPPARPSPSSRAARRCR